MDNAFRELRQLLLPAPLRNDKELLQLQCIVRRNGDIVAVNNKFNDFHIEANLIGEAPAAGKSSQLRGAAVRKKLDQIADGEQTLVDREAVMKAIRINRGLNLPDGSPVLGEHIGAFRIEAGVRRISHCLAVNHHFPEDCRFSGKIHNMKGVKTSFLSCFQMQRTRIS